MAWNKKLLGFSLSVLVVIVTACSVSYNFTGAGALDYTKYHTINIADFPIKSTYVYIPLGTAFNTEIKDKFARQTKLELVKTNADLEIEGEITGYTQYNEAVAADGYSSKTKLTVTVNVRFSDNVNSMNSFDNKQFSAFRTYESTQLLTAVQDELIAEMVTEIVDQIFMATVANW